MKTLFTLTLSIFWLFSFSQELELEFAKRYGIIQNDRATSVNCVKYYENEDKWLVTGVYNGQVNVGIGSSAILTADEDGNGFVAIYDGNFDLLHHFGTSLGIISAELTNDQVITCGRFGTADFDLNSEEDEIYESLSNFGNGYLAAYDFEGNFNWSKVFYSEGGGNRVLYCTSHQEKILMCSTFDGSAFGGPLIIEDEENSLEIYSGETGGSVILMAFDNEGNYLMHHQFYNEIDLIRSTDYECYEGVLYLGLEAREGNINIGINDDHLVTPGFPNTSLICAYDLEDMDLLEYYVFESDNSNSGSGNIKFSKTHPNDLLVSFGLGGMISYYNHLSSEILQYHENDSFGIGSVAVLNVQDNSISKTFFQVEEAFAIRDCLHLENNDFILSTEYEGDIYSNGVLIEGLLEQEGPTSALFYLNHELNGLELFNFNSNLQSEMSADILLNPSPENLIIAGDYSGNHDIDFSSSNVSLGNVSDDQAGFLASYTFDSTSDVNEKEESSILIYPNPASSQIFLEHIKSNLNNDFQILDNSGKVVQIGTIQSSTIDISSLKEGSYILVLSEYSYPFIKASTIE